MSSGDTVKLLRSAPYFPVADVETSVDYYESILGFKCEYSGGEPLQFAICSRDGLAVMLRRVEQEELIVPMEKQGGTWDAFFWVKGVRTLFAEFNRAGAEVVYSPVVQEAYHVEEFVIRDCDRHVLGFGQSI